MERENAGRNSNSNQIILTPKESESPFYNWSNFRKQLNELMKSIDDWLRQNDAEEINLPVIK